MYILETEKGEEKEDEMISASSSMGSKTVVTVRNPWHARVSENYLKLGNSQKEITGNPFGKGLGLAFYCLGQFMTLQRNRLTCRCLFGRIGNQTGYGLWLCWILTSFVYNPLILS